MSPQGGTSKEQVRPQPLVQVIFRQVITMSVLHLAARPGQLERSGHRADSVVRVGEGQSTIARLGRGQGEPDHG